MFSPSILHYFFDLFFICDEENCLKHHEIKKIAGCFYQLDESRAEFGKTYNSGLLYDPYMTIWLFLAPVIIKIRGRECINSFV